MFYCINPRCEYRQNPDDIERCQSCGTPLLINEKFHLIQPLRPLNSHGYVEVFEGIDESGNGYRGVWEREPGARVVIKVLRLSDPQRVEMMQQEAYALQLLSDHPGLPSSFLEDYFTFTPNDSSSKLHCLAMQKFEGQNLAQWLETHGPISQSLALNWLEQLVVTLDYVHQADFFHRDIKPANIIIQPSGEIALIDFGGVRQLTQTYLAKIGGAQNTTGVNEPLDVTVVMTAGYTPPEQFNGKALPQSDFFAVGRTFAHLMTGIHPNNLPSDPQTGELVWRDKAPQIDKLLADFIDELMANAPGKRPYNTQLILQRLNERTLFQAREERLNTPTLGMELTASVKINEFPARVWTLNNGNKQFDVEAGYHFVRVEANPDVFQKLEQAQEKYSRWVAEITGQIGEKTSRGFVLKETEIKIQSFDEKPEAATNPPSASPSAPVPSIAKLVAPQTRLDAVRQDPPVERHPCS